MKRIHGRKLKRYDLPLNVNGEYVMKEVYANSLERALDIAFNEIMKETKKWPEITLDYSAYIRYFSVKGRDEMYDEEV